MTLLRSRLSDLKEPRLSACVVKVYISWIVVSLNCPYKEGNVRFKEYSCDEERPAARPTELQKNEKQNKNT